MPGMIERCSVCRSEYEVQFRYQMEERDGGFAFFCSQACHGKSVRGEVSGGVRDGDQVILNPPVDLTDGHKVQIRPGPPAQLS